MTSKVDGKVSHSPTAGNENQKDMEELEFLANKVEAGLVDRFRDLLQKKADPRIPPEVMFTSLQEFAHTMAKAMNAVIEVMEDVMCSKDPQYPRGLLAPSFMGMFIEMCGGQCGVVKIPEDIVDQIIQSEKDKSCLH